ncbi:ABC transporter permease [Dactylosporangium sp. NPDC000555]|uniref:ABC transporter permease n=1 Tax=Dactylosporangium sp. NPDC000555 TaxID=3154260 RepID=UPI0033177FB7
MASSIPAPASARKPRRRPWLGPATAIAWLTIVILAALTADLLPISEPDVDVGYGVQTPPFGVAAQVLGTDAQGRSILSRLIYGARVSLGAAATALVIAIVLGLIIGVTAGYVRGKLDTAIGLLVDVMLAFPALILLLALAAVLGSGISTIIIGLSIAAFPSFARLARSRTLQYAETEYVHAARGLGARRSTILLREVLPAVAPPVLAYAGVIAAVLVLAEAALSFLGLGVVTPTPSWGNMIADGRNYLQTRPHLVFIPATVLFLTILSCNTLGEWLRERSDAQTTASP